MVKFIEPAGESLAGVRIFRTLTSEERESIARQSKGRRVPVGYELVHDGEQSNDVYFVISGKVRATFFALSGKEVSFRDIVAGEVVGDLAAIDDGPRSATVVAVEESTIVSMSSAAFWRVMEHHPPVTFAMLRELTSLIRSLSERVVEYSTLGVKNRIHAELLRLARRAGDADGQCATISPTPTHAEIASRISTHREAVTRELSHLTNIELLERADGALIVRDLPRLQHMVDEVKGV